MTITIATVIAAVKRHLSIIGKRLYTKEGNNLFADITLSSAEDTEILTQYINASVHDIEAALKQFITPAATPEEGKIKFEIENTRGDSDFDARTTDMVQTYFVLNTVGEYLSMLHPDIAQKYQRDAVQRLQALIAYVFYKKPPTAATASPLDPPTSDDDTTTDTTQEVAEP